MKYGSVMIDDQSLDTQLNLATDFSGSLKSISVVRSIGKEEEEEVDDLLFFCSMFCSNPILIIGDSFIYNQN